MPLSETKAVESSEGFRCSPIIGWLPIPVLPLGAVAFRNVLPAWGFMWSLAFAIYFSLKWLTWWRARTRVAHSAWRSAAYLLGWPGMDADAFLDASQSVPPPAPSIWFWATFETFLGATLLWIVARSVPQEEPLLRGWVAMLGVILLLHFARSKSSLCCGRALVSKQKPSCPPHSAPHRLESFGESGGISVSVSFLMS